MTLSGASFEDEVAVGLPKALAPVDFAAAAGKAHNRPANNADVLKKAQAMKPGQAVSLLQTRLTAAVGGWELRGDVDLIKLSRDAAGGLHVLVAVLKATAEVKVEHRLQVAFYRIMLETLFADAGVPVTTARTAVLFRPPVDPTPDEAAAAAPLLAAATAEFGLAGVRLEVVADPDAYARAAHDLVLAADSTARRVAAADLPALPYCLSFKCDGCLYTEFCMKASAEAEDLSLLPYLSGTEKEALRRGGVTTVEHLATLKAFAPGGGTALVPAPGREADVRRLAATWPVGLRLDELVHRAKAFRRFAKKDGTAALPFIPDHGNSTLPVSRPDLNPNLVWLYVDAQHDPLEGRLYLLGALAVGCKDGVPVARRPVVRMTAGPPDTAAAERDLFVGWTRDLLAAVLAVAQSAEAPKRAPVHVVFFNRLEHRLLLEGLARNFPAMLEQTPPLYDFLTQIAAFDSPIATFLADEVRAVKNYPMTCQSLQSVAAYLKFDWAAPHPFRQLFRARQFDYLGKLDADGGAEWYTKRAWFGSSIPPAYAYAAWSRLPAPAACPGRRPRRRVRRLPAGDGGPLGRVPGAAAGGHRARGGERPRQPEHGQDGVHPAGPGRVRGQGPRPGPRPGRVRADRATGHAGRLEGDAPLAARAAGGGRRAPAGELPRRRSRIDRGRTESGERPAAGPAEGVRGGLPGGQPGQADQVPGRLQVVARGAETEVASRDDRRRLRFARAAPTVHAAGRGRGRPVPPVDDRRAAAAGRAEAIHPDAEADAVRAAGGAAPGGGDGQGRRRPGHRRRRRGRTAGVAGQRAHHAVRVRGVQPAARRRRGPHPRPVPERVVRLLVREGRRGPVRRRPERPVRPPRRPAAGRRRAGLGRPGGVPGRAGRLPRGLLHAFEPGKRDFIGRHAATPVLLVQGPPGTGKSYSTAFAVFARLQGTMTEKRDCRVFLTCKTHAATDVLLANARDVQAKLRELRAANRKLFDAHFDKRLLDVSLYRVASKDAVPDGVIPLAKDAEKGADEEYNADAIREHLWAVVGVTPGGTYGMLKQRWPKTLFGHELCDLLVLDEESQMNLPEALMAALPLAPAAPVVVVGDHRQMPPIVQHDWDAEARRTFRQYAAYRSLFDTLRLQPTPPPLVQFAESFRLHGAMAEFLRREVYHRDGIAYHSKKAELLPARPHADPFAAAVLDPAYRLVVVVHDEAASQVRNPFEQALIAPLLRALADPAGYGLDASNGLGVVVPHRAQRAALQDAFPELSVVDPATGRPGRSAVDTVERFQGRERTVVLVSATESDRGHLLASAGFLLDPRRLTVAVSRAKRKMVLVASRSVFALFSPDADTFANALLWKNLLSQTCTTELWAGERDGVGVTVWGGR